MKNATVSIIKEASNCPVVQVSSRKFPGMVLQGDTLFSFAELARTTRESLADGDVEKAADLAEQLEEALAGYLSLYESVLVSKGIKLPYFKN